MEETASPEPLDLGEPKSLELPQASVARSISADAPTQVVGIGASAGGLEALERFFSRMPVNSGLAFVVIQHLSPDFKSLTDELLSRRTPLPMLQAQDGQSLRADTVFLLPPKKDMIVSGGRRLLKDKDPKQGMTLPIDHFLRSLAQDLRERAIAIILSGTGSDGSRGLRDIHEAGGLVLAQTPESAKFDGMPKSAIKTGCVDLVLSPEEMPEALLRYVQHPLVPAAATTTARIPESGTEAIFRLLRSTYDIDFSLYKPNTVARRIERRMLLNSCADQDSYIRLLSSNPAELNALFKDLLIGVTKFFRDAEAFAALEREVLPGLLQQVRRGEEFRAWVAGCATGEEAYSIAMLLQEQLSLAQKSAQVKIFATDVHQGSLEAASAGLYDDDVVASVSPARLQRWFVRKNLGQWQVAPELRKLVVFAQHNVIKDAPFTKLNLITCRNLLIYLQPEAQKKALSLFHFGLRAGGILMLGPSETPGDLGSEFEAAELHWKIFRKSRDVRLPTEVHLASIGGPQSQSQVSSRSLGMDHHLQATYDLLLDEFMPPSLLLNENHEVLQSFAGASKYLHPKDGRFTTKVMEMVEPELRTALTTALQQAAKGSGPVVYQGVRARVNDQEVDLAVTVRPLAHRRSNTVHLLVALEERHAPPPEMPRSVDLTRASQEQVAALETELRYTQENLQATIEELETSNEELQAANEELIASNEELQSTNEELHSVNEELYTVNAEYQKKINELTELTTDMENLLTSTALYLIFLDRDLCIRKFTPRIAEAFNLLQQDVGRRIDSFTHSIIYPELLGELEQVLRTEKMLEREVRDRSGHAFLLRILPYRTATAVEGVVLTMVDIDSLKRAQAEAYHKNQQLIGILENSPNPVFIMDCSGRYLLANAEFTRLVGTNPIGRTPDELFPRGTAEQIMRHVNQVLREGTTVTVEIAISSPQEARTFLSVKFPVRDEFGHIIGVGGLKTDATRLKQSEQEALEAVRQRELFLAMLSHELRNPLAAVQGTLQLLFRGSESPQGAMAEALHVIDRRVQHMARLLDDLLDVSRVTQNRIGLRSNVFDLGSTVRDVLEETKRTMDEKGLTLQVNEPGEPLWVEGDPDRLQQIQVNLLLNAAKYTDTPGTVIYTMRKEGEEAVIRVRDSGQGIAPEMLERIFDLFVRLDRPGRPSEGTGVGLTLVRSIVELHGG